MDRLIRRTILASTLDIFLVMVSKAVSQKMLILANRQEVEDLLNGYGRIDEMRLMSGFGFLEFSDARDAADVVKGWNCRR